MDNISIFKFKNIDINKINISDFDIKYYNNDFMIQCPIFYDYDLININDKKYIELKIDDSKISHLKFLTFLDSIELKINNFTQKQIKTQVITNIQNKKSIKIKLTDQTSYYDSQKNLIDKLSSDKISLLISIDFFKIHYSLKAIQILEI